MFEQIWYFYFPFIALYLIIAILAYCFIKIKHDKMTKLFEEQAQKKGGRVQKKFLMGSVLVLPHQDKEIVVSYFLGSKKSSPWTKVSVRLSLDPAFKMTIYRESVLSKIGKTFGMQDIQFHNPSFDTAFLVQTNDEMIARNILTPEMQQIFLNFIYYNFILMVKNGHFELKFSRLVKTPEELGQTIDMVTQLLDKTAFFN